MSFRIRELTMVVTRSRQGALYADCPNSGQCPNSGPTTHPMDFDCPNSGQCPNSGPPTHLLLNGAPAEAPLALLRTQLRSALAA